MKKLKVASSWWNKFDASQQSAFVEIWKTDRYDINDIRKFLTAAKKKFDNPEYGVYGKLMVINGGTTYCFMRDDGRFVEL